MKNEVEIRRNILLSRREKLVKRNVLELVSVNVGV